MRPLLSILPPAMLLLSLPVVVGFAANPWVSVDDSDYRLLLMCDGKTTAACYFANHTEHVEYRHVPSAKSRGACQRQCSFDAACNSYEWQTGNLVCALWLNGACTGPASYLDALHPVCPTTETWAKCTDDFNCEIRSRRQLQTSTICSYYQECMDFMEDMLRLP